MRRILALVLALAVMACQGDWVTAPVRMRDFAPPPVPGGDGLAQGQDLVLPLGYGAQAMATSLTDPRAVFFESSGLPLVVEGSAARLSRVEAGGVIVPVATGGGNGPWTGGARLGDHLFVAEAGGPLGGRILTVAADGGLKPLPVKLPSGGVLGPMAAGADGWLYLGIAVATAAEPPAATGGGPAPQDVPCQNRNGKAGKVPCTGSVLRISPDGSEVELVAWGFRRPVGLAFTPAGRLLVADDNVGPVAAETAGVSEPLWAAVPGHWYGWPQAELAATESGLEGLPNPPPAPVARFEGQVQAVAVAVVPNPAFGSSGQPFVSVAAPGGTQVAFADSDSGAVAPFATNLIQAGPLAFAPDGASLWVADAGSGKLWRITAYR